LKTLSESEPGCARAVVVNVRIHCALEEITRVRCKVANPHVEIDDESAVIGLTELDMAEAFAAQNHLQVEVGCLRPPRPRIRNLGRGGGAQGK